MTLLPDPTDLTAKAAALEDQPESRGHVLLIDDQPWTLVDWLPKVLPNYTLLPLSNLRELRLFLAGHQLPTLPPGPYNVVAALIDLHFGREGGSGISTMHALRTSERWPNITPIILTRALEGEDGDADSGNLHAVLCAYANGGAILTAYKDPVAVRNLERVVNAACDLGRLVPTQAPDGMGLVRAVRLDSRRGRGGLQDIVKILLGTRGLRALWGHYMSANGNYNAAIRRVRDEFPGLDSYLRAGNEVDLDPARDDQLIARSDFGDLACAWLANRSQFWNLPDGILRQDEPGGERAVRVAFGSFAERYGALLADERTHAFAEWYVEQEDA